MPENAPICRHGIPMVHRAGAKNGKPWSGFFCPTPRGTPNQCPPVFQKVRDPFYPQERPQAPVQAPTTASTSPAASGGMVLAGDDALEVLKSIDRKLSLLLARGTTPDPNEEINVSEIPF